MLTPDMRVCAVKGTNSISCELSSLPAQSVSLFGENDDRAAFGSFVGQRGKLRGVGHLGLAHAGRGNEFRRLAIAQRDGPGLVEQQRVHVARGFDGAA